MNMLTLTSKRKTRGAMVALAALSAGILAMMQPAVAQTTYPEPGRVVQIIVGASAGSGQDVTARIVADAMEKQFPGSRFQIVNKPGAGTQIAYQAIADAAPDGYTFGILSLPNFVTLYLDKARQAQFDRASFAPIANFIFDPAAIAVRAESPYHTLQDLIDAAKTKPDELKVAVGSPRGREQLDVTALEQASGISVTSLFHDDSSKALNTLLGGNADAQQGSVGDFLTQVEAGRVRLLAVFAKEPSTFVPDVPTAASLGYPIESGVSRGFTFPDGVPAEIIEKLSDGIRQIVESPDQLDRIKALGFQVRYMSHEDVFAYAASEEARISELLTKIKD